MRVFPRRASVAVILLASVLISLTGCRALSAKDYFERGMAAMKKKDYEHARIQFSKAISSNTLYAEAYYQNGVAAQESRDLSAAYESLLVAERMDRKPANEYYSLDIRLRLGLLMLYGRDYQGARQRAQWVLARDQRNQKAHELMAFVFSALAQPQMVTQELDEVLAVEPRNLQARMMRASIYFAANEQEEAVRQMTLAVEQTHRSPESLLALGNLYQVAGQPEKAEPLYREAIEGNPKNTNAHIGLAWLYARLGNRAKAEDTFRAVAKLLPDDPDAAMALGNYYLNQLELPLAIHELERVSDLNKSTSIKNRLAGAYYLAGQYDDALKTVQKILVSDSQDVDARLLLGMLYLRLGNTNEAVGAFTHVLHYRSDLAPAHFYLGVSLYNGHNEEVALQEMENALRLDPFLLAARIWHAELLLLRDSPAAGLAVLRDTPDSQRDLPVMRLLRALCDQAMNNDAAALDEVRSLLSVDPKLIAGFYTMGFGRLLDRHIQLAEKALELGLRADPASLELLQVLARNYQVQGHSDQAIARVQEQMKLINPTPEHLLLLGDVYRVSGQYSGARTAFEKALAILPNKPAPILGLLETDLADGQFESARTYSDMLTKNWPTSTLAWTWRGVVMEGLKNYPLARQAYQRALQLDANQPVAAHNLARRLLQDNTDMAGALNWAIRARDLEPNNPIIADTLGWIYFKLGSWHFAEGELKTAVKGDPRNSQFLYHYGAVLFEEGQDKDSMEALREALRLNPKMPDADDAKRRIEDIKERMTPP